MNRIAAIFGIKGYKLTNKEKHLFKIAKPWGIILFSRNIKNISQLKTLIDDIKKTLNDRRYPVLIDQEGGKVSRLNRIINLSFFSQDFFGKLYNKDKKLFYALYKTYVDKVCNIFKNVGININTAPVLDVRRKKSHSIIGSRSFSEDPKVVSKLGSLCIDLYKKNKIATVIKHIPGHGLSKCDSHYNTPIITTRKKELVKNDFKPFKVCKSLFAMTAHAVYTKFDPNNTATHSQIIINKIIRNHIHFKGLLISDDISMKALKYKIEENAIKALTSGCNLVLHCNGNISEMSKLVRVIPKIDNFIQKKTSDFYKFLG
tara:strand:+ start:136 stop:1083 length:948 start_codon:yes stop_codon:yes gene_type:complete